MSVDNRSVDNRYSPGVGTTRYDDPGAGPAGAVPNLQTRTVVGVFDRASDAEAAAHELQQAGYAAEDLSIVRKPAGTPPEQSAGSTKADSGTVTGAGAGAVVGGLLGLAALAIPGVGPLLAAGPIAAALSGAVAGAVAGGALGALAGSFVGLGVPTERAREYEEAVRAGGVVVAARVADDDVATRARDLMERCGARDATSYTPAL